MLLSTMLLAKLLLLPVAVASSVTIYVSSVPTNSLSAAIIPSPIPLVQISYDADQTTGTVTSYTPPQGSYASDHLLRIGLLDTKTDAWRGVLTSAVSFAEHHKKKFVVHVDDNGNPYHVGFGVTEKETGEELEVEIVRKEAGPRPVLNKPIVLNADGKIDTKEPEKTFIQKYWWMIALFLLVQMVAGGGKE